MSKVLTSVYDADFLEPIYKKLEVGSVLCYQSYSRCGGLINIMEFDSKEAFELILNDRKKLRPQDKIKIGFNPRLVWDGPLTKDVLDVIWDNDSDDLIVFMEKSSFYSDVESVVYKNNRGKNCKIYYNSEWSGWAYVPLEDGTVKAGAY